MRITILPIVITLAFAILALAAWAFVRALKGNRVSRRHAIVLMACCMSLWLGSCFFFMILASLGHSAHPVRDSWHQCAISFFILVVAPFALLFWRGRRRLNGYEKPY